MTIKYLFVVDFEEKNLIDLPRKDIKRMKEPSDLAKRLCLNKIKQSDERFQDLLQFKQENLKIYALKNSEEIIFGVITDEKFKPDYKV